MPDLRGFGFRLPLMPSERMESGVSGCLKRCARQSYTPYLCGLRSLTLDLTAQSAFFFIL
ncbi:hypothetical protein HMPREF9120_01495 [Neisseria sp. oral taxon 020 str. F0370]|nr:hypothetical protein HMPREF9120_01495 [Neisseria sp. oral taxon 020 str. F0370]